MAAAAASSLLSGILADGLDGPGVVGEGLEGSDWFCAFTVGASASQEVAKTRKQKQFLQLLTNILAYCRFLYKKKIYIINEVACHLTFSPDCNISLNYLVVSINLVSLIFVTLNHLRF